MPISVRDALHSPEKHQDGMLRTYFHDIHRHYLPPLQLRWTQTADFLQRYQQQPEIHERRGHFRCKAVLDSRELITDGRITDVIITITSSTNAIARVTGLLIMKDNFTSRLLTRCCVLEVFFCERDITS